MKIKDEAVEAFTQYRRKQIAELRPYQNGEDMIGVSISAEDYKRGSPKPGDMIARNPKNHADQWLVAAAYFAENFEPIDALSPSPVGVTDEMVEAAKRIRDTAMEQTMAARIPESGHFGAIAQDADWLVDHLTAALPHMGGVSNEVYQSAVKGRADFRQMYRDAKSRAEAAEALNAELVKALEEIASDDERGDYEGVVQFARAALGGQSNE